MSPCHAAANPVARNGALGRAAGDVHISLTHRRIGNNESEATASPAIDADDFFSDRRESKQLV